MKKIIMTVLVALLILPVAVAQPSMEVSKAQQDPVNAVPGQTVDIWVSFENKGSSDARDIDVEFVDSNKFTLMSERERNRDISIISPYNDRVIKYTVAVDPNTPEGTNYIDLRYEVGNTRSAEVNKRIPVDVKSTEPTATITNYELEPSEIQPGSEGTLTIEVENLAGTTLRDFTLGLNLDKEMAGDVIISDPPFIPVAGTDEISLSRLTSGESNEFEFQLESYPDALASIHKIPVYMTYTDDSGEAHEKNSLIGLKVNSEPELDVRIDSSDLTKNQRSGDVNFIVVNKDIVDAKLTDIQIGESDSFELLSTSNARYMGLIETDDFDTARFNMKVENGVEEVEFPVTLTYRDNLNNEYEQEFLLTQTLAEGETPGSSWIVITAIIVLLVVAAVYYKKRKKKEE